jgi:putative hydrolase of the HAD superfamily
VLNGFGLNVLFNGIIESSVVGIRKPDPAIFLLGVNKLALKPEEVLVVGDSNRNDIVPAKSIGCQTIRLKGIGWEEDTDAADAVICDFGDLNKILNDTYY